MNKLSLIKEMRKITGIGILKCKKYLEECNFNINLAIYNMRKDCLNINIKLLDHSKEGVILVKVFNCTSVILRLHCLTDFVSKNDLFIQLGNEILNYSFLYNNFDVKYLNIKLNKKKSFLQNKLCEEIYFSNIVCFKSGINYGYNHLNRIGAMIMCSSKDNNKDFLKKLSMHVVANNPIYISVFHIPYDKFNSEIELICASLSGKKKISCFDKIIVGKITDFLVNNVLISQKFLFNAESVFNNLLLNNFSIINYCRIEI